MKDKLRTYITAELIKDPTYPLTDDEVIMGTLIDSFSLVQVAMFIEDTFGAHFDDSELTVENMGTLNKMVANIQAKLQS